MKNTIYIFLTIIGFSLYSTRATSQELDNFWKVGVGFHGLEGGYEWALSNDFVWDNNIGLGMGMWIDGATPKYMMIIPKPVPFAKTQLKWMYSTQRRIEKGKDISNNSASYIGAQAKYSFGNTKRESLNSALLIDLHWGIQRSLGGNFFFKTNVGFGFLCDFDIKKEVFTPTGAVILQYRIK